MISAAIGEVWAIIMTVASISQWFDIDLICMVSAIFLDWTVVYVRKY